MQSINKKFTKELASETEKIDKTKYLLTFSSYYNSDLSFIINKTIRKHGDQFSHYTYMCLKSDCLFVPDQNPFGTLDTS